YLYSSLPGAQSPALRQGLDHATGLGNSLTCDIEGRSVIDGRADDGQADGDIDARLEAEHLDRNVSLIVVHRDDEYVIPTAGEEERGVSGQRPVHIDSFGTQRFECGNDL